MVAEYTHDAGINQFVWAEEQVSVRIDRIREDSRFNVAGEILVRSTRPAATPHLHRARLNLTSTSSRKSLAKTLAEREPDCDWYSILEEACVRTIDQMRAGEPVRRLRDVDISDRVEYRLEPFLPEGHPTLIHGLGGTGKSLLALYFANLIAMPFTHNGLTPEPGNALYLDWEFTDTEARMRSDAMLRGIVGSGDATSPVYYRFCYQALSAEVEELRTIILENSINFLIIDSAGPASGGDPENAASVLQFFSALRALRVSTLILAHEAKNTKDKSPFGSVYWYNMARSVFQIRKSQAEESDQISIGLYHRKSNTGRLRKPWGLGFRFEGGDIAVEAQDVAADPTLAKGLALWRRLQKLLTQEGGHTVGDAAEALDVSPEEVRSRLNQYKGQRFQIYEQTASGENVWVAVYQETH